ncbi:hypothetical protein GQ42DRAFT_177742 [Ramicandelaber brevisporus]|nr:hypothetical protein GQ42DRAFT_177742 [Ramicandelaber brevisporus]
MNSKQPVVLLYHEQERCSDKSLTASFIASTLLPAEVRVVVATNQESLLSLLNPCSDTSEQQLPDVFLSFMGPTFPERAWPHVQRFLKSSKGMAVFGGVPFTQPYHNNVSTSKPEYAAEALKLGPFEPVDLDWWSNTLKRSDEDGGDDINKRKIVFHSPAANCTDSISVPSGADLQLEMPLELPFEDAGKFWVNDPCCTFSDLDADYGGSSGSLDVALVPLLEATLSTAGNSTVIATPLMQYDHLAGSPFAGSRVIVSMWKPAQPRCAYERLAPWIRHAVRLVCMTSPLLHVSIMPTLAHVNNEQSVGILGTFDAVGHGTTVEGDFHMVETVRVEVEVCDPNGTLVENVKSIIALPSAKVALIEPRKWNQCGLYKLVPSACGTHFTELASLTSTPTARNLLAIPGTTYMDSSVHRQFWEHPNPHRWMIDMADLAENHGIRIIRTGLWAGWTRFFSPSNPVETEKHLAALDAFMLAAAKNRLHVIFTFFAFYPSPPVAGSELNGEPGKRPVDPWLSRVAIEYQLQFMQTVAKRYRDYTHVSFDLINEPTMGDPTRLWSSLPVPMSNRQYASSHTASTAKSSYTAEHMQFAAWLLEKHGSVDQVLSRWRVSSRLDYSNDILDLAPPKELDLARNIENTAPHGMLRAADFARFTQDVFTGWAAQMQCVIVTASSSPHRRPSMVAVGQDTGYTRPLPHFHPHCISYTSHHPWWLTDTILAGLLLHRVSHPARPLVAQELGVMTTSSPDRLPLRTESGSRELLERRMVTALAAGSASVIEWQWVTNQLMTDPNERGIGARRAGPGAFKQESTVISEYARFSQYVNSAITSNSSSLLDASGWFDDSVRQPNGGRCGPVWVVALMTWGFVRPDLAKAAMDQAVRTLAYECGIIPQTVIDEQLVCALKTVSTTTPSKMPVVIICPAVQMMDPILLDTVMEYAKQFGIHLVITGTTEFDYDMRRIDCSNRDEDEPLPQRPTGVASIEHILDETGRLWSIPFSGDLPVFAYKQKLNPDGQQRITTMAVGDCGGSVTRCPIPVEMASSAPPAELLCKLYLGFELNKSASRWKHGESHSCKRWVSDRENSPFLHFDVPNLPVNLDPWPLLAVERCVSECISALILVNESSLDIRGCIYLTDGAKHHFTLPPHRSGVILASRISGVVQLHSFFGVNLI